MVLAISFLEAPIKFRAPGITIPLGVGIGRLVFRALNAVEAALAVALVVCVSVAPETTAATWVPVAILIADLAVGAGVLRPVMDRRVVAGDVTDGVPRHNLHFGYIGLEVAKVVLLIWLGIVSLP
ncbi:hypothetical protein P0W64_00890 [Tsukamurella sp. 8F]|nr:MULTISPECIES: hypothetical protein [unclassified Tsukamurella]MDF0529141.1 hypothetical protein [Tsukamurella sp. 8J]MDF0585326.1 hypothetical protein [Tsukamurella sp. 8F]